MFVRKVAWEGWLSPLVFLTVWQIDSYFLRVPLFSNTLLYYILYIFIYIYILVSYIINWRTKIRESNFYTPLKFLTVRLSDCQKARQSNPQKQLIYLESNTYKLYWWLLSFACTSSDWQLHPQFGAFCPLKRPRKPPFLRACNKQYFLQGKTANRDFKAWSVPRKRVELRFQSKRSSQNALNWYFNKNRFARIRVNQSCMNLAKHLVTLRSSTAGTDIYIPPMLLSMNSRLTCLSAGQP